MTISPVARIEQLMALVVAMFVVQAHALRSEGNDEEQVTDWQLVPGHSPPAERQAAGFPSPASTRASGVSFRLASPEPPRWASFLGTHFDRKVSPYDRKATGELTGRFVLRGKAPPPRPGVPVDESLRVSADGQGIADVVFALSPRKTDSPLPVLERQPSVTHRVEIREGRRFIPRVLTVRKSDRMAFWNNDRKSFNLLFRPRTLPQPQTLLMMPKDEATSDVGPAMHFLDDFGGNPPVWLEGRVLVTSHGFASVTDKDGRFRIEGVPVGRRTFTVWHERLVGMRPKGVIMEGKTVTLVRGQIERAIKPGNNDLGTIVIAVESFSP